MVLKHADPTLCAASCFYSDCALASAFSARISCNRVVTVEETCRRMPLSRRMRTMQRTFHTHLFRTLPMMLQLRLLCDMDIRKRDLLALPKINSIFAKWSP